MRTRTSRPREPANKGARFFLIVVVVVIVAVPAVVVVVVVVGVVVTVVVVAVTAKRSGATCLSKKYYLLKWCPKLHRKIAFRTGPGGGYSIRPASLVSEADRPASLVPGIS